MPNFKALLLLFLTTFAVACTNTDMAESTKNPVPEGIEVSDNVQVTMRDGSRLNTRVILPSKPEGQTFPTILIRTPYKTEVRLSSPFYKEVIANGYAIVMQHERGRYFSEGEVRMLGGALNDGWDTLDWIAAQPWSNGDVGTYGCSSSAENQLKLASANHPAHKAMVVGSSGIGVAQAGPFKEQGNFWRGGVWQQGWMNYFYQAMFQDWPQLPEGLSNEHRQQLIGFLDLNNAAYKIPSSTFNETRMHLPMVDIMDALGSPRNEVKDYLLAGPYHESWSELRVSEGEIIKVPGLWYESLYDISARSTIAYFEWNRQANQLQGNNNHKMRVTQGGHCSFGRLSVETQTAQIGDLALGDMRYDYAAEVINWFNHWLKGEALDTANQPAYTSYLANGTWHKTDELPVGGNEAWYLSSENKLSKVPDDSAASIQYLYDPNDPVPSIGGEIYGEGDDHEDGGFDQSALHARQDVIVFTSEPLTEDLPVFGLADIKLSVSSNQPDTDFTVKINDVNPDGKAFNIGNTILRMRYRNGIEQAIFMQEGEVYGIELPPIMLSRVLAKGHRLQVEVSSSNFPSYARNLNTRNNPYTSSATAVASNTLHFGKDHQSFIKLPVIQ